MTRSEGVRRTPRAHVRVPSPWPYGEADELPVRYAQAFAAPLTEALGPKSFRWLACESGLPHATISGVVMARRGPTS